MASVTKTSTLSIVRQLISELRRNSSESKIRESEAVRYIMDQCRKYQTTELQVCKAREEAKYMAQTYLCYLQSSRMYNAINKEYTGKGERSVKDTADMLGFKLPHDPK